MADLRKIIALHHTRRFRVLHIENHKMSIVRSTFVINKEGAFVEAIYGVNPNGHAQEILGLDRRL